MPKHNKLKTPEWILKGEEKPATKKIGKNFKVRKCPKCGSDNVGVVIGEVGIWECKKCRWKGKEIKKEELGEEELMKYMDEKDEGGGK